MAEIAPTLVLASTSQHRHALLRRAGLDFEPVAPEVDERAVEEAVSGSGVTPDELARILAEAKARSVAANHSRALVIGADQTLSLDDRLVHKPADMDAARRQLLMLSGCTHHLNTAVVIMRGEELVWSHLAIARMTMRQLAPAFIGRYLAQVGDRALSSVGAYQIEAEGIQLFDEIEGDFFAIVGLPLLPLMKALRRLGVIDA
jgi:septum formation protein